MKFNIWNFPKKPLPDVLSFVVDNRGKTVPTAKSGHMLIATNCVRNENLYPSYEKVRYLSEDTYQNWFRAHPVPGDILFVCKGTPGRTCMVPDPIDFCIAQDMVALRVNPQIIYNKYLLTVLRSKRIQKQIEQTSVGDVIPHFKKSFFDQILIPVPPMHIQQIIGDFYFAFSNKVELNKRINNNLEQQARSLFKSWFVDYIPFGNTMPSNWKNGKLKDILKLKRKSIKAGINTVLPYLPIDVIPMRTFALTDFKPNAEAQSSLLTFEKDDIIIGAMRVYFHRVVLAPCDGITRTTCFTLAPYHKEYLSFALLCCDQDSSIDYAQSTSKGSTMPYAIWEGGLGDMEIAIPTLEIAQEFNEIVLPMLRQIQNSYFENNRLREIRDELLPRLMSGELDVSDIDL